MDNRLDDLDESPFRLDAEWPKELRDRRDDSIYTFIEAYAAHLRNGIGATRMLSKSKVELYLPLNPSSNLAASIGHLRFIAPSVLAPHVNILLDVLKHALKRSALFSSLPCLPRMNLCPFSRQSMPSPSYPHMRLPMLGLIGCRELEVAVWLDKYLRSFDLSMKG